ncbi:hypothetical protein FOXB_15260 [Fusarium oxysporum f. sp. conglutinans Fo5176]|uniref:Zn(2)-C6 fungal-type domain-containing protein n=1 Tax=Fusarium oxysporum (strain Fo5176) TaxID=660025 RepID=F9G9C8_FUSOF|nr:hypothetical protein FOXB_15260 [Fusarium oxysporum f. sp. conglutinans Fo5176]
MDESDYHRRTRTIPGTARYYSGDAKHFFQDLTISKVHFDDYFKSDTDSSDQRGLFLDYLAKGIELGLLASPSFPTPLPTRPSRMSPKLRQKGPQSLIGICNRDTISKDNTAGDEAQMDNLVATYGRKFMGIKHQEQHEETSLEHAWIRSIAGPGYDQKNGPVYEVLQTSKRRPRYQRTYVADSYIDSDYDDDEIIEADGRKYVNPKQSRSHENNDKINAAARVSLDGPHKDSDGYESERSYESIASDLDGEDLDEWCGCSICSTGRIICDLGQPSCQKCIGRGFTCPGYGPRLRWVQGVAIRGHLRGVQFPIPEAPTSTSTRSFDRNTQQLLDYYDKNIARLMVWIDSEKNYYRQKVLPLAQTNEAVRLAICAVSAQHAARDFTPSTVYEKDRDHVLSMIMRGVDDMTAHPQLTVTADTAEWMLSSMMVLKYADTLTGGGEGVIQSEGCISMT